MSGHADTIRDYVKNTERYDGQWHRLPTDDETLAALDALLAENQRLKEELTTSYLRREADGLIAENQRLETNLAAEVKLRKALGTQAAQMKAENQRLREVVEAVLNDEGASSLLQVMAREALRSEQ